MHADLQNPEYVRWRTFLKEADRWSREQIASYQLEQLRSIISYAYQTTPGYARVFKEAGISPEAIRSLDDVKKIPFLRKEAIRDHLDEFSVPVEGRVYITTGGSTGIPTGMYRDPAAFARELASKAHQYSRFGWKEGDRQIVFRGLRIDSPDGMDFVEKFNELRCSTYDFVPERMEMYRRRAMEYQPEWIRCYPSSGYLFARFLKETRRTFPKVKGILCSSEHLYDFQRDFLYEVFGSPIFAHYGHYEMAALAGFCEHEDTYHVLPQYGYVELLGRDDQPVAKAGDIGEIVATSFIMHATPFIRYRTQDLAVLKGTECASCSRPYQIWERIQGRLQEFIVTKSGRYFSTSMLNMHDEFYDPIEQFQFYQDTPGVLVFRFIPKTKLPARLVDTMKNKLLDRCSHDVDLKMEEVTRVDNTHRGKQHLLIQRLNIQFDHPSLRESLRL